MRGAPPGSAPMHYLRTHVRQGSADRQGRRQTGGRGTPRLVLLRQYSRRGRNLLGKKGGGLTRTSKEPLPGAKVEWTNQSGPAHSMTPSTKQRDNVGTQDMWAG